MKPAQFTTAAAAALSLLLATVPAAAQIVYPFPTYSGAFRDSSVRVEVTPRDAEVYVDGYYAGTVDEFDGVFQRLRVEPGQHEIAIYRDGYRTHRQQVYLARDRTFRIRAELEPLAPGEAAEARPTPGARAVVTGVAPPRIVPPRPLPGAPDRPAGDGRLSILVQPADAEVLIDGQPWPSAAGQDAILVDVSEGRHVIQVRKAGYVGYLTEVDVRPGETETVTVNLRAQP
jgi:hypothetical protein